MVQSSALVNYSKRLNISKREGKKKKTISRYLKICSALGVSAHLSSRHLFSVCCVPGIRLGTTDVGVIVLTFRQKQQTHEQVALKQCEWEDEGLYTVV